MSLPVITTQMQLQCPHAAMGTLIPGAAKVLIDGGGLALVAGDTGTFAGCPFTVPAAKPQPCVKALLMRTAAKVLIENKPALLMSPADVAQSAEQIPNGPVLWAGVQAKVLAT